MVPHVVHQGDQSEQGSASPAESATQIPKILPVLPLRGLVVFPLTAVPLTIGQSRSIRLVDDVMAGDERLIALVTSRNPEVETPTPQELFTIGTVAMVHRMFRAPDGTIRLVVQGLLRCRLVNFIQEEPYLKAEIADAPETVENGLELEAMARNARDQFEHIADMIPSIPRELVASVVSIEEALQTVYTIANFQRMDLEEAQALLEEDSTSAKLLRLVGILTREVEVLEMGQKIQNEARSEIDKVQREYYLREQLKAIQRELGEGDEQAAEIEEFRQKIEGAGMPEEAEKQARRELDRLRRLPTAAAEYGVIRTYLDWLVTLPWSQITQDNLDIANARQVLDQDHFGLKDVKERILEYLAVRQLRRERKDELPEDQPDAIRRVREGVILCFIGPPGVGKTSLGRSIARALGRKFVRISLGGMRDEAEIRGHRRTYIGAMPGRIIQSLRRIETRNPVFMLDEVDKLVFDFHGDPASALLEVLDPEQNVEFRDHYMEVPFDLSQVMFITTANLLEPIPEPLRDRMEIITLSGYTENEKIAIARGYLIPRQLRENGLRPTEVTFSDAALEKLIRSYTREAGVRNLEREIGSVCRKVVTMIAEAGVDSLEVTPEKIQELLGRPHYFSDEEIAWRTSIPGVATGLAWTPFGGDVLFIEATRMPGNKGFQITGSIGNVMQESAHAALSFVRSKASNLGLDGGFFDQSDIHLHIPAGATPKDGPSAGVAIATALVSLVSGRPVRREVGMTGEITLRGQVLPVGGIKEKVLAAHRSGLKSVILPSYNEADLEDIPDEVRKEIQFVFAETVDDVLKAALEPAGQAAAQDQNSNHHPGSP
ncbi:MAG: endopeptidase La [Chloroflexi bacterium RBG_16_57_11]|nr:MAG: endopeptidase La [Chloroflexi bacterium RBG_16_57_11]